MKLQNTIVPVLMASAILVSGAAQAAPGQGTLGNTSTGTIDITLTKDEKLQISELQTIALAVDSTGGSTGTSTVCIYRSGLSGYTLTASGDSDLAAPSGGSFGTEFGLNPASGSTGLPMEYTVKFRDTTNPQGLDVFTATPLSLSTPFTGTGEEDCGGVNASGMFIDVTVAPLEYTEADNVAHTGVLSLTVAPE